MTKTSQGRRTFSSIEAYARAGHIPASALARIQRLSRQTQTIDRLVIERVRAGLNQAELARRMGCSQSYISKLEDSKDADLKLGEIERYCSALGITADLRFKS